MSKPAGFSPPAAWSPISAVWGFLQVSNASSPQLPWWNWPNLGQDWFHRHCGVLFLQSHLLSLLPLVHQDAGQLAAHLKAASFKISWRVVLLLLALGILDYFYQRYSFEKSLRMTKQEVKDEMRQVEGDPRVKARLKSLMRQLASRA
jgi:hypothetical protein